ncbi:male sterility protein-domain-containing protein [Melanogaster broomeanus]|nr:male sterility protein-domain-containing protein [Melanogaster broomeanus]
MSRLTEQFLHVTGEVTNPVPLENILKEDPIVHSAIMFGYGRYNAGVLIELQEGHQIDTNDEMMIEEMRIKFGPTIERMNMFAPQHSRVYNEMVIFASRTKPFTYSSRGMVHRQSTLAGYNDDIKALYKSIEQVAHVALKPPKIWSPENSLNFVRGIVVTLWGKKIDDDADLFQYGADSMQVVRIRMMLFHALHTTAKVDTRKFPGTIVYQYRTISSLAGFATRAARGCLRHKTESILSRCLAMTNMAKTYSSSFPEHQPSTALPYDDVVLITGTTDLFGSNLLVQFLQDPRVSRVYALGYRKDRDGSLVGRHDRQAALLRASGLDPNLAHHPKLTLLETEVSGKSLGLSQEIHDEILSCTTHIVHNAWLSTFDANSPLSIFDGSVRMLRDLVDFALSSPLPVPPRLLFISSTDTLRSTPPPLLRRSPLSQIGTDKDQSEVAAEAPVNSYDAAGSAYGESKWVGEQILTTAASQTPLQPIVVRVGQMCGAVNGRWGEGERFPMIVKLSAELGALPRIDEDVSWMLVCLAAKVVAEMRNSFSTYLHVAHPDTVSSLSLLRHIGKELQLPIIPLSEWITKLEERLYSTPYPPPSTNAGEDTAITLLQYIRPIMENATMDQPARIFRQPRIASDEAWFASPTLHGGMKRVGVEDVKIWVQHWRDVGMIPSTQIHM